MNRLEVLQALYSVYPNTEFTELAQTMYLRVLVDVPLDELEAVVLQYVSSPGAFPPSPGDLKELWRRSRGILQPIEGAQGCIEDIRRQVRSVGHIGIPEFNDPITARVVNAWGWKRICQMTYEEENIAYAQMRTMYEAFAKREQENARMTPEFKALVNKYKQLEDTNGNTNAAGTSPTSLDIVRRGQASEGG